LPFLKKYNGIKNLFSFKERYADAHNFSRAVNIGLKSLCNRVNVQEMYYAFVEKFYTTENSELSGCHLRLKKGGLTNW